MNVLLGIFAWLFAAYFIAGAYFNWDFFFDSRKAQPFVKIFGRNGARIFYGAVGIIVFIMGILCIFGS